MTWPPNTRCQPTCGLKPRKRFVLERLEIEDGEQVVECAAHACEALGRMRALRALAVPRASGTWAGSHEREWKTTNAKLDIVDRRRRLRRARAGAGARQAGARRTSASARRRRAARSGERAAATSRASALSRGDAAHLLDALGVWPALEPRRRNRSCRIEITDSPLDASLRPSRSASTRAARRASLAPSWSRTADLTTRSRERRGRRPAIDIIAPDGGRRFAADAARCAGRWQRRNLEARLLVAADGVRSRLRELAGIKCVGWSYPQTGHRRDRRPRAAASRRARWSISCRRSVRHPAAARATARRSCGRSESERGEAIMAERRMGFLAELDRRFGHQLGEIRARRSAQPFRSTCRSRATSSPTLRAGRRRRARASIRSRGRGSTSASATWRRWPRSSSRRTGSGSISARPSLLERYERWRRFDSALSATAMDGLNRALLQRQRAAARVARSRPRARRPHAAAEAILRARSGGRDRRRAALCSRRAICRGLVELRAPRRAA